MAPTTPASLAKPKNIGKRARIQLSVAQKLEIGKKLQKGVEVSALMTEYGVGQSTIYDCWYKSDFLQASAISGQTTKFLEKRKRMKKPLLVELDEVLYKWFCNMRAKGNPLSGLMITEKAKQLCETMNIETEVIFSDGWLRNFKQRHGIRFIDVCDEKNSADCDAAKFIELKGEHLECTNKQEKIIPAMLPDSTSQIRKNTAVKDELTDVQQDSTEPIDCSSLAWLEEPIIKEEPLDERDMEHCKGYTSIQEEGLVDCAEIQDACEIITQMETGVNSLDAETCSLRTCDSPPNRTSGSLSRESKPSADENQIDKWNNTVTRLQERSTIYKENDEYDNFSKHIVSQLRLLPIRNSIILQEKIQSLIVKERLLCQSGNTTA